MKKVLVTGGTVFVSRYIAEYDVAKGYEVYVLNRNTREQSKGVKLIQADRHNLGETLREYCFDIVVDTAYNATDVDKLLDALGEYKDYILISSSAVYPEYATQPFKEESVLAENKFWGKYGTDKIEAENNLFNERRKCMKKFLALSLALVLCMTAISAFAEDTVQTILQAGTTQSFTGDAIPREDLETILQAGLSATSAINQQPWFFAAVTNQDVMAQLTGGMGGAPFGAAPGGMALPEGVSFPAEGMSMENVPAEGFPAGGFAPSGNGEMPAMPAASTGAKAGMGDSPVAIVIYMNEATSSPNPSFDCGLACQNMVIAANALGYGTKIISSPTMTLNGDQHDALCETLGVDKSFTAVAVLLVGKAETVDAATSASVRSGMEEKVSFVE